MINRGNQAYVVSISIAGYRLVLNTEDGALAGRLRSRYADFLSDTGRIELTIDLLVKPDAQFVEIKPGPWVINNTYSRTHLAYRSYLEQGAANWETRRGYLEMNPQAHVENFLRVIYAWLCLRDGGLLLHAAGMVRQGDGYAFFGPSGAGKTTTTLLSQDQASILSDDLVILRCGRLYGVPFRGDFSGAPRANQSAPLRGIFRLKQDTSHYLEPLPTSIAVAELAASSPFVVRDISLGPQLLAACRQIVDTTPVHWLHFERDHGFWKVIDEHQESLSPAASSDGRAGY